jgi:hypothetical protein
MAFIYNVTFDALDAIALGRFWAQVTGYAITEQRPDFVRLRAPDGRGVRHILFFAVPDPTPGKNRMHIDLAAREPDTEVKRLLELGATLIDSHSSDDQPTWRGGNGTRWVAMQDPEGNEFCLG